MIPTTPTGSRVTSTSTFGRTLANFSPGMRKRLAGEEIEDLAGAADLAVASGSVLPSSRASRRASSSRRARISVETRSRMSCRSCGVVRDQAGKAACAAATAASIWAASAWAYSPTTSLVFDGLTLRETPAPSTHSPAM